VAGGDAPEAAIPVSDDLPNPAPSTLASLLASQRKREWIVPDWIPKGVVSSLSGDGGMGKTLLAQQLLYATGLGGKWLGIDVPAVRGLGVFCEDDEDELHRRHNAIKADLGTP
jgi:RecA-family ATPase